MRPALLSAILYLLGGLLILSGLGSAALGLFQPKPAAFFVMFYLVVACAGAFALLLARRRGVEFVQRSGQAVGLVCIAGAVASGAVLADLSTAGTLSGQSVRAVLIAHAAIAGLFAVLAGLVVLMRRPQQSFRLLLRSVIFALPLIVALVLIRAGVFSGVWTSLGQAVQIVAAVALFFISLALFAGAAHCMIRAFEIGVESAEADERAGLPLFASTPPSPPSAPSGFLAPAPQPATNPANA